VTLLIDKETLLVVRRIVGEQGRLPVLILAVIVVGPLLIDAVKNASRYRWRGERRRDAVTSWAASPPATTPRRFRAGAAKADLTWRERAIVEQGQLAHGTVLHHGELTSVRYAAPWGDVI